jgi:hypothetical protein
MLKLPNKYKIWRREQREILRHNNDIGFIYTTIIFIILAILISFLSWYFS